MAVMTSLAGALGVLGTIAKVGIAAGSLATGVSQTVNAAKGGKGPSSSTPTETSKVSPMTRAQLLAGNQSVLSSSNTATSTGRGRLLGN